VELGIFASTSAKRMRIVPGEGAVTIGQRLLSALWRSE